jgi:hypothetical protein
MRWRSLSERESPPLDFQDSIYRPDNLCVEEILYTNRSGGFMLEILG